MTESEPTKYKFCSEDNNELAEAASVAINDVLGVKEGEKVLIITNPPEDVRKISMALYDAALEAGAKPVIMFQPVKSQLDFAEKAVIDAIRTEPDVVLSISKEKLGKDEESMKDPIMIGEKRYDHMFNFLLGEKRIRSFWSPSVTADMFKRTVPIDYTWMRETCTLLKEELTEAISAHITTELGMDLTIGLQGRAAKADDGDFTAPGSGGNLPCGEVFISPAVGSSEGVIIFDGSIAATEGEIIINEPIRVTMKEGYIDDITGGEEAKELKASITRGEEMPFEMSKDGKMDYEDAKAYSHNARHLGEFGIGLNKEAQIIGNMLEDEKVYTTIHLAIGANYDDDANALIHLDGLIKNPTVVLKKPNGSERTIMLNGQLVE